MAMAHEHRVISELVEASSHALLASGALSEGVTRARSVAARLRRHIGVEERQLFGRAVASTASYADHQLSRDHTLILKLLQIIDKPGPHSLVTPRSSTGALSTLAALRRLHHLLEHHDDRELEGICAALDVSLSAVDAAELASGLIHQWSQDGEDIELSRQMDEDDHSAATALELASPGPYADALWRAAVEGEPLHLPSFASGSLPTQRALDASCAALAAMLGDGGELITVAAFDHALRVDRLLSRTRPSS